MIRLRTAHIVKIEGKAFEVTSYALVHDLDTLITNATAAHNCCSFSIHTWKLCMAFSTRIF